MQTEVCRTMIGQLLAYMNNPQSPRDTITNAIKHTNSCTYCQANLNHLGLALNTDQEDIVRCHECEEQLPYYLQAEIEGQADQAEWQTIAFHIKTCPHCTRAYQELAALMTLASGEESEAPPTYPTPDLSFLSKPKVEPQAEPQTGGWLDEMGRLIIQFSTELLQSLQPPTLAVAGLKKQATERVLAQYYWQATDANMEVSIMAEAEGEDSNHCTVIVEVNIPGRGGWPNLADTEVVLKRNETALQTGLTDAFGHVLFEEIATEDLSHLRFEIVSPV